jgi:hypothetical protein
MPTSSTEQAIKRVGATIVALLALQVSYLQAFWDRRWAESVAPLGVGGWFPWLVFLVAVGYLTVSFGRDILARLGSEAASPATENPDD